MINYQSSFKVEHDGQYYEIFVTAKIDDNRNVHLGECDVWVDDTLLVCKEKYRILDECDEILAGLIMSDLQSWTGKF